MGAHYPAVKHLSDEVEIVGVCELDPTRLAMGGDYFALPPERRYTDLATMLRETTPELVYTIMGPAFIRPVAEQCLAAGVHIVLEKPPGRTMADVEAIAAAARRANRQAMVGFQRRFTPVLREARRRILERGPLTMCLLEFHKNFVGQPAPPWGVSTLWEDVVHVVDLARYLCGGAVAEVLSYRDTLFGDWPNCYNAMVRFDNGATAIITGNRTSGGRVMRVEAHGKGIGAYLDEFPRSVRFIADNGPPEEILGADLVGSDELQLYEGIVDSHRHYLRVVRDGEAPLTGIADALETMRLVEAIEHGGRVAQPVGARA